MRGKANGFDRLSCPTLVCSISFLFPFSFFFFFFFAHKNTQRKDEMASAAPAKIPVTVLTGFLGSGKTTFINYLMKENHGMRLAIVENEVT